MFLQNNASHSSDAVNMLFLKIQSHNYSEDDIVITRTNGWTYAIATIGLMFMAVLSAAIYYVWWVVLMHFLGIITILINKIKNIPAGGQRTSWIQAA